MIVMQSEVCCKLPVSHCEVDCRDSRNGAMSLPRISANSSFMWRFVMQHRATPISFSCSALLQAQSGILSRLAPAFINPA
jgi:hypothetical protein